MKRTFFQRILAALVACLMLAGTLGAVTASAEDRRDTMIAVSWTDIEGNTQVWPAIPVESPDSGTGIFWVQVPAETLGGLTLQIESPRHAYMYMPKNGTLLTDVMDAGMTLDGPAIPILAMEEENMVLFMLYVSTQVPYPIMEEAPVITEAPTEEPTPVPTEVPTPVETPIPMGSMINRFGVVNGKQVAVRSEQGKKSNKTVLVRLNKGDRIYMLQERSNDNGENWTAVIYAGQVAYVISSFLDVMTQAESDAYMRESGEFYEAMTEEVLYALEHPHTAKFEAENEPEEPEKQEETSAQTHAVAETPIPEGEMINRFAITNKKNTNVRTEPIASAKKLTVVAKKGTTVYALREEMNADGILWTSVMIDGQIGFIRSNMLNVMTQTESDAAMAGINGTPVPPMTVEELDAVIHPAEAPTEAPTEEPTTEPTEEPTATPMATPTAEPTATPTTEPTGAPTVAPIDVPESIRHALSCYAYTTTTVNYREGASRSAPRIQQLKRYALCKVIRLENVTNEIWYQLEFNGLNGFVKGDFVKQMTVGELINFILSDEFNEGILNNNLATDDSDYNRIILDAITNIDKLRFVEPTPTPIPTTEPTPAPTSTPEPTLEPEPFIFRSIRWGDTKDKVIEKEGEPEKHGEVKNKKASYISYSTNAAGLPAELEYYFCDNGLYTIIYRFSDEFVSANKYIEDYTPLVDAYKKKYGDDFNYNPIWDTAAHQSSYSSNWDEALALGYLSEELIWDLNNDTRITYLMHVENGQILTTISYTTTLVIPEAIDYSDEI